MPDRREVLTRATLTYEQIAAHAVPLLTVLAAFLAFVALDIAPLLPGLLALLILLGFVGGGVVCLWRAARAWRLPPTEAARRRLELAHAAPHRPLAALSDRLAGGDADPITAAFWAAHRRRMEAASRPIRAVWPRTGFLSADPYGVRSGFVLLALVAIVGGSGGFDGKLARALTIRLDFAAAPPPPGFDLWITPPDYTGQPPIYFGAASQVPTEPLAVPTGSHVLAQIHGARRGGNLTIDRTTIPLVAKGAGEFAATAPAVMPHRLALDADGGTLLTLAVAPVADQPPTADWSGPAETGPRGELRLAYKAHDDYGIVSARIRVVHAGTADAPLDLPLEMPGGSRDVQAMSYQDLTSSRWAGSAAELTLEVTDAAGQSGTSAHLQLNLPERQFVNPSARAVIEMRKHLMAGMETSDLPVIARALTVIALNPEPYGADTTVFLALRAASYALDAAKPGDSVDSVIDLLWSTALRIEDGRAPDTLRALRQAEQALRQALDRNAPPAEIEALTRAFQQAMQRYLQALASDAARDQNEAKAGDPGGKVVTPEILQQMLDRAQEMARTGGRDAAREALRQLEDMLESLRAGAPRPGGGKSGSAARQLQDLARRQQDLLDRAFRAAHGGKTDPGEKGQPGGKGDPKDTPQALSREQDALRRALGDARDQMGALDPESGKAFDRAERAMRDAATALNQDQPGAALEPQGEALQRLQEAARQMAQKSGNGHGGPGDGDPMGRDGTIDRDGVKLPADAELHHSREILDELRRRAADRTRPQDEREYINRLLERF